MSSQLRASILLSQNFLRQPTLARSLIEKCDVGSVDVVYEIGPGKGIMTALLAQRARQVVAIEKDARLANLLRQRFASAPHVTIHHGDFLDYPLPRAPYKVVANMPFNVTSAIVGRLMAPEHAPDVAYLTMQREAADVLVGSRHETLRSVLLKPWFETEVMHRFRRADFIPAPRVDVVMLRLRKRGPPLVHNSDRQCYRDFVVYGFTRCQPGRGSALKRIFTSRQVGHIGNELSLDLDATPTSIRFEQWLSLFEYFTSVRSDRALRAIAGSEERLRQQQRRLQKVHRTRAAGERHS